jgi:DNA-directed RNA polymerase specialized sigma24 family protein
VSAVPADLKSDAGKAIVLMLKVHGFPVHRIAALFDVNQGRITDAIGKRPEKT